MKFIIATHSFLVCVTLNKSWQVEKAKIISAGYHYGVALVGASSDSNSDNAPERIIVYRGGNSVNNQNEKQLLVFENGKCLALVDEIPLSSNFGDIHQLAYANDGIYLTNTAHNSIVFRHLTSRTTQSYHFEGRKYDYNHVNSVFPVGSDILVILHNRSHKESQIGVMNHNLREGFRLTKTLSLWGLACHNIYVDKEIGWLLYNSSRARSIVAVDLQQDRIAKISQFDDHSKGLSVTKNFIVVGLSEHTVRDRRSTSRGQLLIMNRRDFRPVATVDLNLPILPHPIGNINEIRCISEKEYAHACEESFEFDLSSLKLARKDIWNHRLFRLRTQLLKPVRRLKNHVIEQL